MLRQHKKIKVVVGLTISALMISSACYAQDDPNDGYILHYDFETQETAYYGYDKENHEFYEVDEVDDYVEPDHTVSDGTVDIADAPDEMEGVKKTLIIHIQFFFSVEVCQLYTNITKNNQTIHGLL